MADRFFDLDSFLAEAVDEKPVRVQLFSKSWQLPPSVPVGDMLRYLRVRAMSEDLAKRDPEETLTDEEAAAIRDALELDVMGELRKIAGDVIVDTWVQEADARKVGLPAFASLFWRIVRIYEGAAREDTPAAEGEGQGEGQGPQPGPTPSSDSAPSSSASETLSEALAGNTA